MILLSLLILSACLKTEILNEYQAEPVADTVMTKRPRPPQDPPRDTTERVPIGFNPSVEDWENQETDL